MINARPLILSLPLIAVFLLAPSAVSPGNEKAGDQNAVDDPMHWDKYEHEVGNDRFSRAYIDSVMAARNTKDNHGLGNEVSLPYQREKLVFDGGWGVLRAGWGMLVTEPAPSDPSTVNFIGKVFSNSFVSAFYKVRDYVQAHCDASNLYPLFFEQHISEGRYTDQRWTIFDHRNLLQSSVPARFWFPWSDASVLMNLIRPMKLPSPSIPSVPSPPVRTSRSTGQSTRT